MITFHLHMLHHSQPTVTVNTSLIVVTCVVKVLLDTLKIKLDHLTCVLWKSPLFNLNNQNLEATISVHWTSVPETVVLVCRLQKDDGNKAAVIGSRCCAAHRQRDVVEVNFFLPCLLSLCTVWKQLWSTKASYCKNGRGKRRENQERMLNCLQEGRGGYTYGLISLSLALSFPETHTTRRHSAMDESQSHKAATHLCRSRVAKYLTMHYRFDYKSESWCPWAPSQPQK